MDWGGWRLSLRSPGIPPAIMNDTIGLRWSQTFADEDYIL